MVLYIHIHTLTFNKWKHSNNEFWPLITLLCVNVSILYCRAEFALFVCTFRKEWGLQATYQQHPHCHHGCRSSRNGAVHQNHMVLTDVSGQSQVVQLNGRRGSHSYHGNEVKKREPQPPKRMKLRSQEISVTTETETNRQNGQTGFVESRENNREKATNINKKAWWSGIICVQKKKACLIYIVRLKPGVDGIIFVVVWAPRKLFFHVNRRCSYGCGSYHVRSITSRAEYLTGTIIFRRLKNMGRRPEFDQCVCSPLFSNHTTYIHTYIIQPHHIGY